MIWKIFIYFFLVWNGVKANDYSNNALLWRYDPASSKLENKAEYWKYEGETWNLPTEGSSGKIQAATGKVLGISGGSTANGTEVTKQSSANSNSQQWTRSVENDQGYFTFQNPISEKFLTASSSFDEDILMITGSDSMEQAIFDTPGGQNEFFCEGAIQLTPRLGSRKFEKTAEKRSKRFKIKKNRRGSRRRHRVRYASVSGTCCWKMCDANGECDEFLLGHDRAPRAAYVYRLQARTCQN